jgi:hypothetical protein
MNKSWSPDNLLSFSKPSDPIQGFDYHIPFQLSTHHPVTSLDKKPPQYLAAWRSRYSGDDDYGALDVPWFRSLTPTTYEL